MKKKIFVVALAACLLILSVAGSSMAYFTDTEQYTNVFTTGDVKINLTVEGTVVNNQALNLTDSNVYPSDVLEKNVTITNISANDPVYVGAIIKLTGVDSSLGLDASTVKNFLTGGIMASASDAKVAYDVTGETITIYVVATSSLVKDAAVTIFNDIVIPATWTNDHMKEFVGVTLDFKAYATQTAGMTDAVDALQKAFPAEFGSITFN